MGECVGLAAISLALYVALIVGHKTISVLLILADDCIRFLMKVFGVKRSRRRSAAGGRRRQKLSLKNTKL